MGASLLQTKNKVVVCLKASLAPLTYPASLSNRLIRRGRAPLRRDPALPALLMSCEVEDEQHCRASNDEISHDHAIIFQFFA